MDICEKVKSLALMDGQYVVFGSGPMAIHGIRNSSDIDLFVTEEQYNELKRREGWKEVQ
jgi:hypothetical protein